MKRDCLGAFQNGEFDKRFDVGRLVDKLTLAVMKIESTHGTDNIPEFFKTVAQVLKDLPDAWELRKLQGRTSPMIREYRAAVREERDYLGLLGATEKDPLQPDRTHSAGVPLSKSVVVQDKYVPVPETSYNENVPKKPASGSKFWTSWFSSPIKKRIK